MKKQRCINISDDVWNRLTNDVESSNSQVIEHLLRIYLDESDEESELMKLAEKQQHDLNITLSKLCEVRERKKNKKENGTLYDKPMEAIVRIYENIGFVGKNQIRNIAKQNDVSAIELEEHIKTEKIPVKNLYAPPVEKKRR